MQKFSFTLNSKENTGAYDVQVVWAKIYNQLEVGKNKIRVTMRANHPYHKESAGEDTYLGEETICYGEFYIVKSEMGVIETGVSFEDAETGFVDEVLEAKITAKMNKLRPPESTKEYLDAKILSEGWYMIRHYKTGVIVARELVAWVLTKNGDGTCYYYPYIFQQQYVGDGFGNAVYYKEQGGDLTDHFCDCPK